MDRDLLHRPLVCLRFQKHSSHDGIFMARAALNGQRFQFEVLFTSTGRSFPGKPCVVTLETVLYLQLNKAVKTVRMFSSLWVR